MIKLLRVIFLLGILGNCFSDDLYDDIDEEKALSVLNNSKKENKIQSLLGRPFTTNKNFSNIQQVANLVEKMTELETKVVNQSADKISNIVIKQGGGTIGSFLDKSSQKFKYSWRLNDQNVIEFSAFNPAPVKVVAPNKPAPVAHVAPWILNSKIRTLRNALTLWSKRAGWQLVWNIKVDFPITTSWAIEGTFEEAINQVLKASQNTDTPLMAIMHDKNHVLEVYSSATNSQ